MKYVMGLLLVFVVGMLGLNLWQKRELNQTKNELNEQLMQANLELGKAQTQFGDANKMIGELETELQESIKSRNESLSMYGKLLAKYNAKGEGKTVYIPGATEVIEVPIESQMTFKPYVFYYAETEKTLRELGGALPSGFEDHRLKIDSVLFTDITGEITFAFNYLLKLALAGELVQTTTESGAVNHYLQLWELDGEGKKVGKFKLTKFDVVVTDQRKPEFYWFAPHLDLGVTGGFDGNVIAGGSIGMSLSGYGVTKNDLQWRILRAGLTLEGERLTQGKWGRLELSPFMWNLGGPIPLVSNIWIGPAAVYGGTWGGALLLNVVL